MWGYLASGLAQASRNGRPIPLDSQTIEGSWAAAVWADFFPGFWSPRPGGEAANRGEGHRLSWETFLSLSRGTALCGAEPRHLGLPLCLGNLSHRALWVRQGHCQHKGLALWDWLAGVLSAEVITVDVRFAKADGMKPYLSFGPNYLKI